jgi:hypothetical protein
MVLDVNQLVEFSAPMEVPKKENHLLRALVDESADRMRFGL